MARKRINAFTGYFRYFISYTAHIREILICHIVLITMGGVVISECEEMDLGAALYFSYITGLTIGYGDITPTTVTGRVLSVLIGMVGMIFTGLTIAVATRSLADFIRDEIDAPKPE